MRLMKQPNIMKNRSFTIYIVNILKTTILTCCLLVLSGCFQVEQEEEPMAKPTAVPVEIEEHVASSSNLIIEVNGTTFEAVWEDNVSAEAFQQHLTEGPITIEAHDYGNFEKVGTLPWNLERSDTNITTEPGDIILFQGNQITLYYDTNTWNFTKLAHIENITREELLVILGEGDVSITYAIHTDKE